MKYEFLENAIIGILFIYLAVGAGWQFLPAGHLYPFFSWSLYSTIPNSFSVYDVRFFEVDGKKYNPAVSYKEIYPKDKSDDLFLLAEDMAISVKSGNKERIKASQDDLNSVLGPGKKEYELIELVYRPLDYKAGRAPFEVNNLGKFSTQ